MMNPIPRRRFLKAAGVSVALPMLESMNSAMAADSLPAPKRMVLICTTLGLHSPSLWPKTPGTGYESTEYLDLLKDHKDSFTLFSGLSHQNQSGRRPHDSEATWLTAARNPGFAGFRNSVSVDQLAALAVGSDTRFPSITLSTNSSISQSYSENGVMIPARTRPSKLFADLFLQGTPQQIEKQEQQLQRGQSVLDSLSSEMKRVNRQASGSDVRLLQEYFDAVRSAEKNIMRAQGWMARPKPEVTEEKPKDVVSKADLVGRVQSLLDLIPLIVQTDSSRVITMMIQDHDVVPQIQGVAGNHHNLSHHGQDTQKIDQLKIIETRLLSCFGSLLNKMKATAEVGNSLLHQTSILFGSNLGNANMHDTKNLPLLLAGGGFQHGKYVNSSDDTPLSNLYLTMLNQLGVEQESFGQSTGTVTW